jgi:hypothetical protein
LILEGLVTTTNADGSPHVAPMGPRVTPAMRSFILRPFPTSQTYRNLLRHGEGVLHVTDDVLLLARSAVGEVDTVPAMHAAGRVKGFVLDDACRAYEFVVRSMDASTQRVTIEADVVSETVLREFFGFNRGKHAVLEAAILATRLHLVPPDEVAAEFAKLRIIVDKTGGPVEQEAMAFLEDYRNRHPTGRPGA